LKINLNGAGRNRIETGIGFLGPHAEPVRCTFRL
jgi:hypothetical protein